MIARLSCALLGAAVLGPCTRSNDDHADARPADAAASVAPPPSAPASASVSSAPAPASNVVLGDYACTHDTWVGAMPNRRRQSDPVGALTLVDGRTYRWLDNGGSGHWSADAAGTITWLDGPIADKKPRRSTYRRNAKTTQIDIVFADGFDWSCGHDL